MTATRTAALVLAATALLVALAPRPAHGIEGRLGIHGIRIEPNGAAKDLARSSWGGGLDAAFGLPGTLNLLSGSVGIDLVNFDTKEIRSKPDPFSFERKLRTTQDLTRFYLGAIFGPYGDGFIQPFVGVHGSLAWHSLRVTLSEEYDDPTQNVSQTDSQNDFGTGWDATVGLNLNPFNTVGLYGGVRYVHLYNINQPLGDELRKINPEYWQGFLGLSVSLDWMSSWGQSKGTDSEGGGPDVTGD